ncbi:Ig-like domain-containing protein, partial [Metapseudomonas otitidis]|uniref:Ig-like domain-containing protein n=1 Tax=Metapseudomonas otitidis TaxID=319939 RepID=UPI001F1F93F3
MSSNTVRVAVIDGVKISQTEEIRPTSGQVIRVKAIAGGKYILAEGDQGIAPENITLTRQGDDLLVHLEDAPADQPDLIIEGFYTAPGQLIGMAEDGVYHPFVASDGESEHEAAFLVNDVSSPHALGIETISGLDELEAAGGIFWPTAWGLGALGLGGAAAAGLGGGGGGGGGSGGGTSGGSNEAQPVLPDQTELPTPKLESVIDTVGSVTGPLAPHDATDDTRPTFNGQGTPGNVIDIYDQGSLIGRVDINSGGQWSFTPSVPLEEGAHSITTVEKDPAGNTSAPSDPFDFIVDTTPPDAPVISAVYDDQGSKTGNLVAGETTDDDKPTVSGTAEPQATVVLYDNGKEVGRTTADANGNWSLEPKLPLANGNHTLTTQAID